MSHAATPITSAPAACLCVTHRTAVLLILAFSSAFTAFQFATGFTILQRIQGLVGWLIVSTTFAAVLKPWPRVYLAGVYAYLVVGIVASIGYWAWMYAIGPEGLARVAGVDAQVERASKEQGLDADEVKRMAWSVVMTSVGVGVVVQTVLAWPWTLVRYARELRWECEEKANAVV